MGRGGAELPWNNKRQEAAIPDKVVFISLLSDNLTEILIGPPDTPTDMSKVLVGVMSCSQPGGGGGPHCSQSDTSVSRNKVLL